MNIDDIVHIKNASGGYWKGKITEISTEWTHTLKNGEVLRYKYSKPIISVNEMEGPGHALVYESNLIKKEGEWYEYR